MSLNAILQKTVREVMTAEVIQVTPTTTINDALDLMFDHRISALPVIDDERCVGIVTATDLVDLLRSTEKVLRSDYPHFEDCLWAVDLVQKQLDSDPVRNIMSEVMVTANGDMMVAQAAKLMDDQSVHHLPVIDDGKMTGMLAAIDIVRLLAAD